jgi:inner membrane protein
VLFDAPAAGALSGILADVDLLIPAAWGELFVHRGITHSALAARAVAIPAAAHTQRAAGAVGVGYASQLLIDATTEQGIPLLYPLSTAHVGVALGGHSGPVTAVLWVCCLGVLWRRQDGTES